MPGLLPPEVQALKDAGAQYLNARKGRYGNLVPTDVILVAMGDALGRIVVLERRIERLEREALHANNDRL